MAISQKKSNRKPSGAKLTTYRKKKSFELGRAPTLTKIGERKIKKMRVLGGNIKNAIMSTNTINVYLPKTKNFKKATIKDVKENPANRHFVRRNIITKGVILDTSVGLVKVTSRPGQEPSLNGILVENK